ncbi:hypothetical protein AHAS_Ahas09G0085000 [Arachis hypogaea]
MSQYQRSKNIFYVLCEWLWWLFFCAKKLKRRRRKRSSTIATTSVCMNLTKWCLSLQQSKT